MAVKIQEGFALFSKRMDAKAFIEGEDESLDNMESQKMVETNKERFSKSRRSATSASASCCSIIST